MLQATPGPFPGYARKVENTGLEGTIRLEQGRNVRIDLRNATQEQDQIEPVDQNPSASSPVVSDVRGHQRILEDFVRCIETGGSPVCDGEEGRRSLALVEAIYRSARQCEAVTAS